MNFTLHSDKLSVTIQSKGAEISSIIFNEVEYIWQAKPNVWPRHAPILFPIVGKLKDNTFNFENKSYNLLQHGFARDKEFKVSKRENHEIVCELVNDAETEKVFPFQFKFEISYKIADNELFCNYNVNNTSNANDLYFSVGAHPGFKIPQLDSEEFTDYSLVFEPGKKYKITHLTNGLLTEEKKELELVNGELKVNLELFNNDALVFEDSQIDKVTLRSNISGKEIELNCKNWPYFGVWSKPGCNEFICLEPWYGIADSIHGTNDLKSKKGIIHLKPSQQFECGFSLKLF